MCCARPPQLAGHANTPLIYFVIRKQHNLSFSSRPIHIFQYPLSILSFFLSLSFPRAERRCRRLNNPWAA